MHSKEYPYICLWVGCWLQLVKVVYLFSKPFVRVDGKRYVSYDIEPLSQYPMSIALLIFFLNSPREQPGCEFQRQWRGRKWPLSDVNGLQARRCGLVCRYFCSISYFCPDPKLWWRMLLEQQMQGPIRYKVDINSWMKGNKFLIILFSYRRKIEMHCLPYHGTSRMRAGFEQRLRL